MSNQNQNQSDNEEVFQAIERARRDTIWGWIKLFLLLMILIFQIVKYI